MWEVGGIKIELAIRPPKSFFWGRQEKIPFGRKLAAGSSDPKSGEGDQILSVSKIMRCHKEQARPQLSKYQFQNESAASHRL